ncbi:alpha/beta fold hydrolase [Paenarthrobacter sp. DKR-5]|uniref:alpha/beta hydrolase family protein n=1 Tax=Paenarthrobacter sp. DKR-5 TaxID=2835535 RepID=UPI001BDD7870|nr:alpha/beta fold hydrolase [Paenarthrobacter sp. DKR-5]MBT1003976.1 alpha/beta fold hydrolase [Paenarthrobacter sp. DKR-5]
MLTTIPLLPVAVTIYAARRIVSIPGASKNDLTVLSASTTTVTFPKTRRTSLPGEFGFRFPGGEAHIGGVVHHDNATVVRTLVEASKPLVAGLKGRWSGIISTDPSKIDSPYTEVIVPAATGSLPAWLFPGEKSSVWALHVHGHASDRTQPLRGIYSAQKQGLTSLVISYRNDGASTKAADSACHLGDTEWEDLAAAMEFAAGCGARKIIVYGWSMGAMIALLALERSKYRDLISGLVLVSPVLDWRQVLAANAVRSSFPQWPLKLATFAIGAPILHKIAGLDTQVEMNRMNWIARAREIQVPVLVLHGTEDDSSPFAASRQFQEANPSCVTLVAFPRTGHTQEWNVDRSRWESAVEEWYRMAGIEL